MPTIEVLAFDELEPRTAYGIWQLRQAVFVVEQQCAYPDLDGRDLDPGTRHLVLTEDAGGGAVIGYLRLLDEGARARIGRVVLARTARGHGLADRLMHAALRACGEREVVLDAQAPLAGWYAGFGFEVVGAEYLDDGIPHLPMRRAGQLGQGVPRGTL